MTPLLEVRGLKVAYGGINAVKGVDLDVHEGEMVALIGANGAGKTTTLKALTGLVHVAGGHVHYRGHAITRQPSFRLVRQGLALIADLPEPPAERQEQTGVHSGRCRSRRRGGAAVPRGAGRVGAAPAGSPGQ